MLVMRATEHPAHPLGELVRSQEAVGLYDLALGVDPLGLDGVQPRTLLRKQATDDPHALAALLDAAVVFPEPPSHLFRDMPARVVPDEDEELLAKSFELLEAPRKQPRRYRRNRPSVHEPDPRFIDPWQIESVAAYGLRLRVVFGDRPLGEAKGLAIGAPGVQRGQDHPAPPALVQEAHRPGVGVGSGDFHQSRSRLLFFFRTGGPER